MSVMAHAASSPDRGEGREEELPDQSGPLAPGAARRWGARQSWRWLRIVAAALPLVAASLAAVLSWWVVSLGPAPLGEDLSYSTLVVDREGRLLRPYTTEEGRWRLPATREMVDPRFVNLLFAYEDK